MLLVLPPPKAALVWQVACADANLLLVRPMQDSPDVDSNIPARPFTFLTCAVMIALAVAFTTVTIWMIILFVAVAAIAKAEDKDAFAEVVYFCAAP